MDIILASASPRRRELLEMLGVKNFSIIPAPGEEEDADGLPAPDAAVKISLAKARGVAALHREAMIIAADTIVELNGEIFGKPRDESEARRMLSALSDNEHEVYTGVTVIYGGESISEVERTLVRFRQLLPREIDAYIRTGEPLDKAGAYGAQGLGSLFIRGIEGDFFNVMGLPLCRLSLMLKKMGVNLI